jgi:hypothetical protein
MALLFPNTVREIMLSILMEIYPGMHGVVISEILLITNLTVLTAQATLHP